MSIIKITNVSDSYVHFRLVYFLDGHLVSEVTPDFGPQNIGQLQLPDNATGIVLTVSILTFCAGYKTIYTESISIPEDICYRVSGSSESAICQKVPCGNLLDPCKPCCCCCCRCCYHCCNHC